MTKLFRASRFRLVAFLRLMPTCTVRRRVRLGNGTSGSNPLCSSGESPANVASFDHRAHRHVFDHACPQRADRPIGRVGSHRGTSLELKVAGPSMLGSGCPDRHAFLFMRSPPPPKTHGPHSHPSRESGFVLLPQSGRRWRLRLRSAERPGGTRSVKGAPAIDGQGDPGHE